MLIHYRDGISQNLSRSCVIAVGISVAILRSIVLARFQLLLMKLELCQQAFAEIAAADSRRIQLTYNFKRFVEFFQSEVGLVNFLQDWRCVRGLRSWCRS